MPDRLVRRLLPALCLLPLLGGCTQRFYTLGDPLPANYEQRAASLTLAEVLRDLGPPLRFAAGDGGLIMAWERWHIREQSLGLSLGVLGVDALEFDWGDARVVGDYLVMTFDRDHRVDAAARVAWDSEVGGGAALQPLSGLVSVVDVEDLLLPLPQHDWGAAQLLPPAEALNNRHRPGRGDTGIEQRGTPVGAGQRAQGWID